MPALTTSQASKIVARAQADPIWWWQNVLGVKPWTKQVEIAEAVRESTKTAVRSCHGAGKSWTAARIAMWHASCFPESITVTTAPTYRQVRNVLWREIHRAYRKAKIPLGGHLNQVEWRLTDDWIAFGFATDVPDNFQGLHDRYVLIIMDEGPGVHPDIWEAIEGVLASGLARLLTIGNPTEPSGPFYDLFREEGVRKLAISAFDTPNFTTFGITQADIEAGTWEHKIKGVLPMPKLITPQWVADRFRKWGKDSPMYQGRVLGQFPTTSLNTVIPLAWVEAAQARWFGMKEGNPRQLGVDVARFGDDETVIAPRAGRKVLPLRTFTKQDTMVTAGEVVKAFRELGAVIGNIDADGVGGGVYDRLAELEVPVWPIHSGRAAIDAEQFANLRAEMWWLLRDLIDPTEDGKVGLPPDEELASQLTAVKYKMNSRGQIVIESKEDMKKRGLSSPDRADAVVYAFAPQIEDPEGIVVYDDPVSIGASI